MWNDMEQISGIFLLLAGALFVFMLMIGCAERPYVVSDGTRMSRPMTHEETVRAAEIRKAWGDHANLHVEISP